MVHNAPAAVERPSVPLGALRHRPLHRPPAAAVALSVLPPPPPPPPGAAPLLAQPCCSATERLEDSLSQHAAAVVPACIRSCCSSYRIWLQENSSLLRTLSRVLLKSLSKTNSASTSATSSASSAFADNDGVTGLAGVRGPPAAASPNAGGSSGCAECCRRCCTEAASAAAAADGGAPSSPLLLSMESWGCCGGFSWGPWGHEVPEDSGPVQPSDWRPLAGEAGQGLCPTSQGAQVASSSAAAAPSTEPRCRHRSPPAAAAGAAAAPLPRRCRTGTFWLPRA
jgi:hypothetical protein